MKWFGVALGAGFVGAVLAAVMGTTAAQAAPSESFSRPITFAERLLIAHNRERDRVGVPRLEWSANLAGEAQAWADDLARSDRFEHARDRGDAGENLWMGSAERYSAEQMIAGFVQEVRHFRHGQFPHVSTTGRWADVGHYTQLVWRDTQEVGCAVARGRTNDVLVCRYWPAGNVIGQRVF
ncbi:MAG: CAP family protein [Novosphingobium sp.]|nr:CAP family protein [Novosphingobium sp.]